MAVRKPSKREKEETTKPSADAWLQAGGSTTRAQSEDEKVRPKLYMQRSLLDLVDAARKPPHRSVSVSQNQWIVEAIAEKLEKEGLI